MKFAPLILSGQRTKQNFVVYNKNCTLVCAALDGGSGLSFGRETGLDLCRVRFKS